MLLRQISTSLRNRSELLISGQFDPLVRMFCYPLPIYLRTKRIILESPDQATALCDAVSMALRDRGVVALHPKITALELPRGGRFRVWVDWYEPAQTVEGTRLTSAVYYMQAASAGPRIEMIAYKGLSLPEVCARVEDMALSA